MPTRDVETFTKDGHWYNAVEGTDQVSEPLDTKEQATIGTRYRACHADPRPGPRRFGRRQREGLATRSADPP